MLKTAGKPAGWFLLVLIPLVNIVVMIMWSVGRVDGWDMAAFEQTANVLTMPACETIKP
jgi:hypothetical protein